MPEIAEKIDLVSIPRPVLDRFIRAAKSAVSSGSADIYYDNSFDRCEDPSELDDNGNSNATNAVEKHEKALDSLDDAVDAVVEALYPCVAEFNTLMNQGLARLGSMADPDDEGKFIIASYYRTSTTDINWVCADTISGCEYGMPEHFDPAIHHEIVELMDEAVRGFKNP